MAEIIKGNHAIAEAAIRSGCRFFSGYPITPQSEILEYMSWRLNEVGGTFVQTESELAGISMLYGAASCGFRTMISSSGPGFSLLQEGISYLAAAEIPSVVVDLMRFGSGLGDISPAQGDYLQVAKNGGHGDYRCIAYAPASIQDVVDYMNKAFSIAEKYRNPVLMACDGTIGQMVESVVFPEMYQHDPDQFDWSIKDQRETVHKQVTSKMYYDYIDEDYCAHFREKYDAMESEAEWESFYAEDAELILVSYGTMSRICRDAVLLARKDGLKLGMIRPITLWPFPKQAFKAVTPKAFLTVEMSVIPQMAEDVSLAARGIAPNYSYTTGMHYPDEVRIIEEVKLVLDNKKEEV
ncbi:MAG: 3-methyl-2-oxobutanoate dehydrogenase subunit VorB [Eubacteriaceae bacterium]|jgi:2-oxoglutarate ferredoxin oxidoreductase subunit alpha|nr:3-methyl-2-oxobutanoate dehydrogenase subunit VorB [Eubacteriaceae bacterium]